MKKSIILFFSIVLVIIGNAQNKEQDYYAILEVVMPSDVMLEVGGLTTLPNGSVGVSTRRGEIFIVENPTGAAPVVRKFAEGLHEILGLRFYNGSFYCVQRSELTRVEDRNGDGKADVFETVASWPLSGNYHEYSYGPVIDEHGHMFVTFNVGFFDPDWWRGQSKAKWRGWTLKIDPKTGEIEPFAAGMRSPCGFGIVDGEFFYGDNQGDWMGSGGIVHLEKGNFAGHPAGLKWSEEPNSPVKVKQSDIFNTINPRLLDEDGNPFKPENIDDEEVVAFYQLKEQFPDVKSPAVWLPHGVLGTSTSEISVIPDNNEFGPYGGQLLVGDQGQSKISRVFLEKVNGVYQGGAILFREGFMSGVLRMTWVGNQLFVGQTNRGWGSTGLSPYGLERVIWTGKTPFEIQKVKAESDGFTIFFTREVDRKMASDAKNYSVSSFIYKYHPVYGSPAVNIEKCTVKGMEISKDGLSVRIKLDGLKQHYIHEINLNLTAQNGLQLLHPTAYYTLNEIPTGSALMNHSMEMNVPVKGADDNKPKPPVKKSSDTALVAKNQTELPSGWKKVDREISIGTKPGLKFDLESITVKAGEKIKITFTNKDDMPHNFLIVNPGKANEVGIAAIKLGINGLAMNYIPESTDILFHTKLLQPGITQTIYVKAPDTPGNYTFVCTYPGHYVSMQGIFKVE